MLVVARWLWNGCATLHDYNCGAGECRELAQLRLRDCIEVFYNRQRLHSGIDYVRPVSRAA